MTENHITHFFHSIIYTFYTSWFDDSAGQRGSLPRRLPRPKRESRLLSRSFVFVPPECKFLLKTLAIENRKQGNRVIRETTPVTVPRGRRRRWSHRRYGSGVMAARSRVGFPGKSSVPDSTSSPLRGMARHVKMTQHKKEPPGSHPRRSVVRDRRVWDSSAERLCDPSPLNPRTASMDHTRSPFIPQRDARSFCRAEPAGRDGAPCLERRHKPPPPRPWP